MKRFAVFFAAVMAVTSGTAASAQPEKAKVGALVEAKSKSVGEVAAALAATGSVRVVVVVNVNGATPAQLDAAVHDGASRAATKDRIAAAVEAVIADHPLGAKKAVAGQPSIMRLTTTPAFAVTVDARELDALAKDPRVVAIDYDRPMRRQLALTLPLIEMPIVHAGGGTGVGVAIAVIDDGVQRTHPFVGGARIIAAREACFLDTNDCPNGTNTQLGSGASAAAVGADHGTHVAGIALGNRAAGTPNKGVAPAARFIPINIFGPNDGTSFSAIQRAFEYVEDLTLLGGGTNPYKIASVNMSVGGGASPGDCDADPNMALLKPVIDSLRARGVLSAVAAGNEGQRGAMSLPGCLSSIVSVAATSRSGVVASYSNISPTTDVFAPGGEQGGDCVVSSVPTNAFAAFCGTSMASPHVAGAIAVLKQKVPLATSCRIEDALIGSGLATEDTRTGGGIVKPRIRVNQALNRLRFPVAPTNNAFLSADSLPPNFTQLSRAGSTLAATLEVGEPSHVSAGTIRSVWWKWVPTTSGLVTIDTLAPNFDSVLAVYRGATSAAALGVNVAQNDNISATNLNSRVSFVANAGQTYHIVVGGKRDSENCRFTLNLLRRPPNDDFATARPVVVTATQEVGVSGSNVGATKEAGEPNHNGAPGHTSTVWFKFVAPVSGPISLDTEGSPLADTVLAVYRGNVLASLVPVAADDDSGASLWSKLTFNMVAGTEYKVAVMGFNGAVGRYRLWFTPAGALSVNRATAQLVQLGD